MLASESFELSFKTPKEKKTRAALNVGRPREA
jgi:hypothetical protein